MLGRGSDTHEALNRSVGNSCADLLALLSCLREDVAGLLDARVAKHPKTSIKRPAMPFRSASEPPLKPTVYENHLEYNIHCTFPVALASYRRMFIFTRNENISRHS